MAKFTLPALAYAFDALEPTIDAKTMEIHHDKHHQAYIDKLNAALETHPELQEKTVEELISDLNAIPEDIRTAVKNHGGGHYNHTMFWESMTPGGKKNDTVVEAITKQWGDFAKFTEEFTTKATGQFGSGWAWLIWNDGKLEVVATPNQDNPLMTNPKVKVLLGLDVWEHAYYLKYQNKRPDYIAAWWSVVDWDAVAARM